MLKKYSTAGTGNRWHYDACALHANTKGYKHTLETCNNYCFSTAKMVARTSL